MLEEFFQRFAEEEHHHSAQQAARVLEADLKEHEDELMRLVRAVFDVVNSDALAPLARLYSLYRRREVEHRVWRRTVRLLVESDSGAIDAMAGLFRAILERWPLWNDDGSPVEYAETARVSISGLRVTVTLLPDFQKLERMWTFTCNDHEHVDGAFDLLTDHFFRFEGPVPATGGYLQIGSERGSHGYTFNCFRSDIEFLRKVVGPQRPPAGPG